MNHTQELLKNYVAKKKEYDKIGDELVVLIKAGVSGRDLDGIRGKIQMVNDDLYSISKQFIEQFIIK